MTTPPPLPWSGKTAEPERAADGRIIKRTRYGAFVEREDGMLEAYIEPEQEWARLFTPRRQKASYYVADTDFDVYATPGHARD
jgi:hypothetical protein